MKIPTKYESRLFKNSEPNTKSVANECVEYFQSGMETIIFMYERPFSNLVNVVMNIDFFN